MRAQQEASEASQKFNDRMASLDEEFDLDDEDRKIIASDIKGLDEEGFAAYMTKAKKLMCGKSKAEKAKKAKEMADKDCEAAKAAEQAKAAAEAKVAADAKEALASAEAEKGTILPNGNHPVVDEKLRSEMKSAFADSFKINGKTVKSKETK
jgi:hypothetical protein